MSDYFNATGTIGFTCDNCGRETQGCTWVNGMKFCAKCYQETFGNTNPFEKELRDKIADLEAKLAELDSELAENVRENECLKEQLAEKDEEIESLKIDLEAKDFNINTLMEQRKRKQKFYNQDKISFAVEQLKFLKSEIEMMGHIPNYTVLPERELMCRFDVFRLIDNQIKQLKEMK